jgi:hypothetical protein
MLEVDLRVLTSMSFFLWPLIFSLVPLNDNKQIAALMPGGIARVRRAAIAKAVLGLTPFTLLLVFDLVGWPVKTTQFYVALIAGLIVQWAGLYAGPFRQLLDDETEASDRLHYNRVHGLPLDEPNRQTEKVI